MANLEEVFKVSGIPTYTFVEPAHYTALRVSLRTPGRCAVIEGPSGIGKTTSVLRLLEELSVSNIIVLSARRPDDVDLIHELPTMHDVGTVVIDDFHRLDEPLKRQIADFMKVLADAEDPKSKLILIGINKAGDHLVEFGSDLGLRIDVFKMETNADDKVEELIGKGEEALNIEISDKHEIVQRAQGSFQLAQMLCKQVCLQAAVTETCKSLRNLSTPADVIVEQVMGELRRIFHAPAVEFARGSKLRREGRAPYLHILRWLAEGEDWSLDLREAIRARPEHRSSVGQVIDKGYLERLLDEKRTDLESLFHYQASTGVISVEDPRFVFYLKNLVWRQFVREAGYTTEYFQGRYDIALSFAGEDRAVAKALADLFVEREIAVFYDQNEQHRILAKNVEEYLAPIYRSEAVYVLPLLSTHYPKKIWTKFESDQFKERFGSGSVIPIRFTNAPEGFFSDTAGYGGLSFDPTRPQGPQLELIVDTVSARLVEDRSGAHGNGVAATLNAPAG